MLVALQADGVASMPLNITRLVPIVVPKFEPVIVTTCPTVPALGLSDAMAGLVDGGVLFSNRQYTWPTVAPALGALLCAPVVGVQLACCGMPLPLAAFPTLHAPDCGRPCVQSAGAHVCVRQPTA